jgi:hypothetical protein
MVKTFVIEVLVDLKDGVDPDAVSFHLDYVSTEPIVNGETVGKVIGHNTVCAYPETGEDTTDE